MKKDQLASRCRLIVGLCALYLGCAQLRAGGGDHEAALHVTYSSTSGLATFVVAADESGIPVESQQTQPTPYDFLRQYGDYFGIAEPEAELVMLAQSQDTLGARRSKFQQVFHGVEVFSGVLLVHQDDRLRYTGANGQYHPIKPGLGTIPTLTAVQATTSAVEKSAVEDSQVESTQLVIVDPGWYGDAAIGAHLAYQVVLTAPSSGYREAFFIDAHSGRVLDRWSLVEGAQQRQVHDANGSTALPGALVRVEGEPPTGDADIDRVYDYASDVYGYFWRGFGRDGIDDAGETLVATVHSTAAPCPNAFWTGFQTVFCEGVTSDDIVAHEFVHGITQHTANLIYQNQPGQINEAFSDIFGELIDLHNGDVRAVGPAAAPNWPTHLTGPGLDQSNNLRTAVCSPSPSYADGVRWLIAEDAMGFAGAIRDMWNPPCQNHPDRANSPLQTCSEFDNGGVHSGCGVANHAFAMMVDGKFFNGYSVQAIGAVKAGAVWYRALTTYLTVASDFEDLAQALQLAAQDLIGTFPLDPSTGFPSTSAFTGSDAAAVNQAIQAVELNTPGRCGASVALLDSSPPLACPRATILFADDFENGVNGWTTQTTGPAGPPTPFVWTQEAGDLPMGRSGTVWHCDNPTLGNCTSQNESAVHSLQTPPISVPTEPAFVRLSFHHYMASEPTYDGGNVSISVNDGPWELIPFTAFEYNPYSAYLRPTVLGNSNPRAGQPAWTSAGGDWGTTVIDLDGFVAGGESIELRFDFSKDGCNGIDGWYIDDVVVYECPDCDDSSLPDNLDYLRTFVSGPLGPIGSTAPRSATMANAVRAAGPVTLRFDASADLGGATEDIDVFLNGLFLGTVFEGGASECALWPNEAVLVIPAAMFNQALGANAHAQFNMVPSAEVDVNSCGNSYIVLSVRYEPQIADDDNDGVIDVCADCQPNGLLDLDEIADGTSLDCNENDRPDECDVAMGASPDVNANNIPDDCDCPVPQAPLAEANANCGGCYYEKNRYLSIVAPPVPPGASSIAIRVLLTQMPGPADCPRIADFSAYDGVEMWVGEQVLRNGQPTGIHELSAAPVFRDWKSVSGGVIHLADCNIVPCATYTVDAVSDVCESGFDPRSPSLVLRTVSAWADVVGSGATGVPNGIVDFSDISAIVDRFRGSLLAPHGTRCDLGENRPSGGVVFTINFLDVSYAVDAFRGGNYPFGGPSAPLLCPGQP